MNRIMPRLMAFAMLMALTLAALPAPAETAGAAAPPTIAEPMTATTAIPTTRAAMPSSIRGVAFMKALRRVAGSAAFTPSSLDGLKPVLRTAVLH